MTTVPERNPAAECTATVRGVKQCTYHASGGKDAWCSASVCPDPIPRELRSRPIPGTNVRITYVPSTPAGTLHGFPGPIVTVSVEERALDFVKELARERCAWESGSCGACAPCRARRMLG